MPFAAALAFFAALFPSSPADLIRSTALRALADYARGNGLIAFCRYSVVVNGEPVSVDLTPRQAIAAYTRSGHTAQLVETSSGRERACRAVCRYIGNGNAEWELNLSA